LAVNLPVLEPHYRHPTVLQKDLSFHIIFALSRIIINRPINFDHQLLFGAIEIHDIRPNAVLTAELLTLQVTPPQVLPQDSLDPCLPSS